MRVTRRRIQVWLGLLWLLDGALQLQPFMFGRGFADQVVLPAGQGQPGFVSAGVDWAAQLILTSPALVNAVAAMAQLAIGTGLLVRSTVRPALVLSFGWALGVWYFGEGLGGLASGHADMLTGAPGAVLLYAVLGAASWPGAGVQRPAPWLPAAWAVLWVGAAALRCLPGQNSAAALAGEVSGRADRPPVWLARLDQWVGTSVQDVGGLSIVVMVTLSALIGVAGLFAGRTRQAAAVGGALVSSVYWVLGQSLGELYTGQATDPNTAPLVVMMSVVLFSMAGQAASPACSTPQPGEVGQQA